MIYTFYSYKGGVGRSMALVNIAELFCGAGKRVLMVDWDLEAPGLERFFPTNLNEVQDKLGIMDMLLDYKKQMSEDLSILDGNDFPFLKPQELVTDIYPRSQQGKLFLLTSGKHSGRHFAEYANTVLNFDWSDFYLNWKGGLYFELLRREFEKMADVVLIDSRTGVTEMGGVCTYQFADVVVMFCAPNLQNIVGTRKMAFDFKRRVVQDLRPERPLNLIIVPSRVDITAEGDQLNLFCDQFKDNFSKYVPKELKIEDKFGRDPDLDFSNGEIGQEIAPFWRLKIPYIPYFAFKELVAVNEEKPASKILTDAYVALAKAMQRFDPSLREISGLIADINWGNIKSKTSSLDEYRKIFMRMVENAKESIYLTCIYPPEFFITGSYLFNWERLDTRYDSQERLINHFKNLIPHTKIEGLKLNEIKYDRREKDIIKIRKIDAKVSDDPIFTIELKGDDALLESEYLKEKSKCVKLVAIRNSDDNTTNIYSGNPDSDNLKELNRRIREKDGLDRRRIIITDIYGSEADWKRDQNIVNDFLESYNTEIKISIGSIRDPKISQLYLGDLGIIDKKTVLIYDPNRSVPNGQKSGRLQLITGDLVKRYLEIFESSDIEWKTPDDFWEWRKNSINKGHND